MKDYFVVTYPKKRLLPSEVSTEKEIKRFCNVAELLQYLDDNKNEKICVYEAECLLDWS